MTETPPPHPDQGRAANLLNAAKSMTLAQVAILALLIMLLIPVYVIWKALSDEALLDRFLSSYREVPSDSGCSIRVVAERGGPERWSIASQWAAQGNDRWTVGVILQKEPSREEITSFCASLKLISDQLLDRGPGSDDAGAVEPQRRDTEIHR